MMKRAYKNLLFSGILLFACNTRAQTNEWEIAETNDGNISVKSRVLERTDEHGNKVPFIEYIATATDILNFQHCIAVMKDVSVHNEFLDVKIHERIKTFSSYQWVNYYVFNAPWPFQPSDCVVRVGFSENVEEKTAFFEFIAAPDLMKKTNMKRFEYYNISYTFKELGANKLEITVHAKLTPPINVPLWMLRASFPGSAAEPLEKLIKLCKK